jgi:hypothetical protein
VLELLAFLTVRLLESEAGGSYSMLDVRIGGGDSGSQVPVERLKMMQTAGEKLHAQYVSCFSCIFCLRLSPQSWPSAISLKCLLHVTSFSSRTGALPDFSFITCFCF